MNLKHASYVLAVLREGSITAAARKLFISQPSLSQTIKQVEQNLGAPIFDRSTDPLSLTYEGQLYVKAVEQVMMISGNLHNEIEELKKETRGRLRLGISIQRGMHLLPLVVPPFTRKYPYVKLELVEHGSDTLERLTIEGECDLALITTNEKPSALEYVLIENEQLVLMADRSTAIAQRIPDGMPIGITEAAQERFVSLRPGHSVRTIQDRLFSLHSMNPTILLESNSLEACKNVTSRAGAVMICPYVFIAGQSDLLSRVHCYPILDNDYERHFYLCYRRGLYLTRYMEDFIEIVRQQINVRL